MNKESKDFLPLVYKEKVSSFNYWLDHKAVLDSMKSNGIISEYLYDLMSIYLREKLGILTVK